ncbi:hypothetical protein [Frigoribacterium sp. Leaf186]|jgi:uncharacterized membrane protein|uniref:hypothetical protein n=1 Tax=Frigoribacterium sp. Leaf186 TaxID=1736293 RepID=UPI0006F495BF|nr:hypothetical protein [Frigoribacterium sp. Leaf186]KQS17990.1 small multidrug efflux protein [Frigoribacterium sp. Leaf186]
MDLITRFQELVAQMPEILQPLIVALAGAVPFIEGEGAAAIGIIGGLHPAVAITAGAIGNFLCVVVLVTTSSRARSAVVSRRRRAEANRREAAVGVPAEGGTEPDTLEPTAEVDERGKKSARRKKFQNALVRYGVPGVSLLGPLLLPTQFTATMLASSGVSKARVLFWQGLAIAGWSTLIGAVIGGATQAVA